MKLEGIVKNARKLVIPSIALALLSYSIPLADSTTPYQPAKPVVQQKVEDTPDVVTTASYYGRGTRVDPKPKKHLRKLDDIYKGEDVWDYFCAMPNRRGELIGEKVRVDIPSKHKSVVLVVADDGPDQGVHPDRKIDISYHAAGYIGFKKEGLVKVGVTFVSKNEKVGQIKYQ